MESKQFLSLLEQALQQKNNSVVSYERVLQSETNAEMIEILENMVEKEQGHLEALKSIYESVINGTDIPTQIYSIPKVPENTGANFKSSFDLLMQSRTFSSQVNKPQPNSRTVNNIRYAPRTHVGMRYRNP